jgi:hypothetical protein
VVRPLWAEGDGSTLAIEAAKANDLSALEFIAENQKPG